MKEERIVSARHYKIGEGDILVRTVYESVSGWSDFFATADWVVEHCQDKEELKTFIASMLLEVEKIKNDERGGAPFPKVAQ